MKEQIGVVKEIDGPRRLVVPKEMRSLFHIDKAVELVVTEEGILLRSPVYKLVKREGTQAVDES